MAERGHTPTDADQQRAREALAGLLVEYSDTDGPVTSYTTGPADGDEDAVLNLAERFAEVRADERAKLQDRIEELEKNLSYEVEQKIKLADTLRDERAKRPGREQIDRIQFEIDNVHQIHGDTCLCGFKSSRSRSRTEHLTALFADAVLTLEPEAREEQGQVEWGVAYRQNDGKLFVDEAVDYDDAVFRVANSSVYDMVVQRRVTAYIPVGAAPAPEAREDAGPALRIDDDGAHIYWADPVEGCWVAFKRVDCVGEEELPERRLPAPEAREITDAERQKLGWLPLAAVAKLEALAEERYPESDLKVFFVEQFMAGAAAYAALLDAETTEEWSHYKPARSGYRNRYPGRKEGNVKPEYMADWIEERRRVLYGPWLPPEGGER